MEASYSRLRGCCDRRIGARYRALSGNDAGRAECQFARRLCSYPVTCGHPQPIIVRRGSILPEAAVTLGVPLGLSALGPVVGTVTEVALQPGDGILLYTDGAVESRDAKGDYFGAQRLHDLQGRENLAGGAPSEVIRRLVRATLAHAQTRLRDDATMLYLRWDSEHDQQELRVQ